MNEPLISVIIPIFNSEQYLDYCLASVLVQQYKNLEVICVNDGSTDGSLDIIEKYANRDNRIKIINQNNQGQSVARNAGIKSATGEWVSFIDSDDWISENLYQIFIKSISNNTFTPIPDIFMFNGALYPDNRILNFDIDDWDGENPHTFDDCKNPFRGNLSACNKIYKREFLIKNNLSFTPNRIFEDQLFSTTALVLANGIHIVDDVLYWYRQHNESTMHNLETNVFDVFEIMELIETLLKNHDLWDTTKYALLQHKYTFYKWLLYQIPLKLRAEFYDKVKNDFLNNNDYDMSIVRQLKEGELYFDFLESDMETFYPNHQ